MLGCIPVHTAPLTAVVVDGEVVLTGPGAMHGAFTPGAAERSAAAILEAVRQARLGVTDAPSEA